MTANAGTTPQSTAVNTAFADALAVTVTDAGGSPVPAVDVTFTAPGSGASGVFSNSTTTITVATNASGVAAAPFTANGTAGGPYTVSAVASGLTTVNFSLTNTSGTPATGRPIPALHDWALLLLGFVLLLLGATSVGDLPDSGRARSRDQPSADRGDWSLPDGGLAGA
jgi:hypothetical protein